MHFTPSQLGKTSRPETDYERWLRTQDECYIPGHRPVYGPSIQGPDDSARNGKGKDQLSDEGVEIVLASQEEVISHEPLMHSPRARFFDLKSYSIICSIILSACFAMVIIKSAKAFRKRRHRDSGIPFSGKSQDR